VARPPKPSQIYTVNGISFNKKFNTFATYGQDGCYFLWNKDNKSKLKSTKPGPFPITAGDYHEAATLFAFAFGYDYGKGLEESKKGY
jgi:mRNA export factor